MQLYIISEKRFDWWLPVIDQCPEMTIDEDKLEAYVRKLRALHEKEKSLESESTEHDVGLEKLIDHYFLQMRRSCLSLKSVMRHLRIKSYLTATQGDILFKLSAKHEAGQRNIPAAKLRRSFSNNSSLHLDLNAPEGQKDEDIDEPEEFYDSDLYLVGIEDPEFDFN
ncbi:hypothetical protein DASC09_004630 [Saccharomycopsis crataegensis]|uniref:Uncharacterized protein n=1 Tax=Saccharomycopsis crataegensis TaxID=43959 RepID=A0AAV5QE81_9ASCO|nr:hypothetical protein DASC09_004630 [Saccharomycopsis crataegensis]